MIRVRNSWNRGLRLYVDDVCQASTGQTFALSRSVPIFRHNVEEETFSFTIEVFCFAIIRVKVKIVVDGQRIGGDNF